MGDTRKRKTIMFNTSKFEVMDPYEDCRLLVHVLARKFSIKVNKTRKVTSKLLANVDVFVISGPQKNFSVNEYLAMKRFLHKGGSILVSIGFQGVVKTYQSNLNYLLKDYGIVINDDAVASQSYYSKYFHPQQCLISDGIVNKGVTNYLGRMSSAYIDPSNPKPLKFLFPFGCTLNVARPAVTLLSTGKYAYPCERPVLAVNSSCGFRKSPGKGKLAVIGSVQMFSDQYIHKEDNNKVRVIIFLFLTTTEIQLNQLDADFPDISDYLMIPSIPRLAIRPRGCIEILLEEIPDNREKLFGDFKCFSIHTKLVPDALKAYSVCKMEHEELSLIKPEMITPHPPLLPAVYSALYVKLPRPALDLYDLEEAFSSKRDQISRLANKFMEGTKEELQENKIFFVDCFIRECGRVLNIKEAGTREPNAKQILHQAASKIAIHKYHRTAVRPMCPTPKPRIPIPRWRTLPTPAWSDKKIWY